MDLDGSYEIIEGAGKGGGGGRAPIEADDTLASRQQLKLLFAVSEGEIDAVEDVFLNKVSIAQFDASWAWRPGTLGQTTIPGFVDTEAPLTPFTGGQLLYQVANISSVEWDVDAVRVTLGVDRLSKIKDGTNDLVGTSVRIEIYTRPNPQANWTLVHNKIKKGKASSPYAWDVIVPRPDGVTSAAPWAVRVMRATPDDSDSKRMSVTRLLLIVTLRYKQLTYPGTALVAITVNDAEQFGGRIPDVRFKLRGRKVKIPNNYNPVTRVYTGTWNLGMTDLLSYYTDNPAWHIYDVLTDTRAGLGIPPGDIDRVSFYQLSQYCDGLVSDGKGGMEPRYTLNVQYYTRENIPTFLARMLSVCNANFSTNAFGQIAIVADRPDMAPTKLVTNANVIDGQFDYTSNDLETRYSLVNVTYNNALNYGETDTVTVSDDDLITRYGLQTSDIVLPGCTSEAQAVRKARWALWTNAKNTLINSFRVLFAGMTYRVGEIIKVMDSDNVGAVQHGVIKTYSHAAGVGTLVVDRTLVLDAGPYTMSYLGADGVTIHEVTVVQDNVSTDTLTYNGISQPAFIGSSFVLSGDVQPRLYRVISSEREDDVYTIAALEYNNAKFSFIETGLVIDVPTGDFVNISQFTTEAIVNLSVAENSSSNGVSRQVKLVVTWDWDLDGSSKYQANYLATWRRDEQEFISVTAITGKTFDIVNAVPGTYEITVWAVNPLTNIKSAPVSYVKQYRTEAGSSTLEPPINLFVTGTSGLTFSTPALSLSWQYNPANDDTSDSLYDYVVELWDTSVTTRYGTYIIKPNDGTKHGQFYLPLAENIARFGTATRQFVVKVFSRDLTGFLSTANQVTVNNPVPAVISFLLIAGFNSITFRVTSTPELDVTGYRVWRSIASNFTKNNTTLIHDGPDSYVNFVSEGGQPYYYAAAAYDSFGKDNLNVSGEQSITAIANEVRLWTKTGIDFSSSGTSNTVSWTSGTIFLNGESEASINSGSAEWTTGKLYIYYTPSNQTTLQTTTLLNTAVAAENWIIATFTGGGQIGIKGGDGSAFFSGSQVLAGTVGANQLVTGSAIITQGAQIGNVIESDNYTWQPGNYNGWRIDKTGYAQFKDIAIRASNGDLIFGSGTGFDWTKVYGTEIPAANATVGANWNVDLSNIPYEMVYNNDDSVALGFNPTFSNWSNASNPPDGWSKIGTFTLTRDETRVRVGKYSVKCVTDGTDTAKYIYKDANFTLTPMPVGTFISGTVDVQVDTASNFGQPGLIFRLYTAADKSTFTDTKVAAFQYSSGWDEWQRLAFTARVPTGERIYAIRVFLMAAAASSTSGFNYLAFFGTVYFDNLRFAFFDSSLDNTAITLSNNGTLSGAGGGVVTITGLGYAGDLDATKGATFDAGQPGTITGRITASNVTTFIANAAILNAQIANAAITNAKIANAAVGTLSIAGNAVIVPLSVYTSTELTVPIATWTAVQTLSTGILSTTETVKITLMCSTLLAASGINSQNSDQRYMLRILEDGVTVWASDPNAVFGSGLLHTSNIIRTVPINTNRTYTLQGYIGNFFTTGRASNRSILILATKR